MNLLGKLDWNAIPLHEPIIMGATAFMVLVVLVVLGFVTAKGAWLYLWRENHLGRRKRIGACCTGACYDAARLQRWESYPRAAGVAAGGGKVICLRSISTRFSRRTARS